MHVKNAIKKSDGNYFYKNTITNNKIIFKQMRNNLLRHRRK